MKKLKTYLALATLSGLAGGILHAQVTLADAAYGSDTPAVGTLDIVTGNNDLLDTLTVTDVLGSDVFVEDANTATTGVGGELYLGGTTLPVGSVITGFTAETGTYYGDEELELPTGGTAPTASGTAIPFFVATTASALNTKTYTATTGGTTGKYTESLGSTAVGDYTPITFTLTTGATGYTIAAGGSNATVVDAAGDNLDFYKVATAANLAANSSYTVTAIGETYSPSFGTTTLELDSATFTAAVAGAPEPSTWALMGVGLVGLLAWNRRRILSI